MLSSESFPFVMGKKWTSLTKVVLLQIILVLLTLGSIEVFLRWKWGDDGGIIRSGWVSAPYPCGNELGFLGDSIAYDSTDRVFLLIGDSQVAADYCTCDSLPSRILQLKLREYYPDAKVFSIGSSGYGNDQQLLHFQTYLSRYRADHVILWQTFSNDVWNNMWPTHWPANGSLKPTYWLDSDGRIQGPDHRPDEIVLGKYPLKLILLLERAYHKFAGWDAAWEKNHFPEPYTPSLYPKGEFSTALEDAAQKYPEQRHENLASEKSHLSVGMVPASPRLLYGLRLTRLLLDSIGHHATGAGATFNILDISPEKDTSVPDTVLYLWENRYYAYSKSAVIERMNALNNGLSPIYLQITDKEWKVAENDSHLNCRTIALMMSQLADTLAIRLRHPDNVSITATAN